MRNLWFTYRARKCVLFKLGDKVGDLGSLILGAKLTDHSLSELWVIGTMLIGSTPTNFLLLTMHSIPNPSM